MDNTTLEQIAELEAQGLLTRELAIKLRLRITKGESY